MKATAFISHFDCSRHDTGWNHPDHQGRLPGLMRAVHADMLTLFDPLLEVEGRHASEFELGLVHSPEYLSRVRGWVADAIERGETIEPVEEVRVSAASWDAATAAVGCALTGVSTVLDGEAHNAFCAVRPPGRYVGADTPGGFGLLNTVATPAIHLLDERRIERVLVLELGGAHGSPTAAILKDRDAQVFGVYDATGGASLAPPSPNEIVLPAGSGRAAFLGAIDHLLSAAADFRPRFLLLSIGVDGMAADPLGHLALEASDYHAATIRIRSFADEQCGGRLVSILEGGFDAGALGAATVQHLRGLAGIDTDA